MKPLLSVLLSLALCSGAFAEGSYTLEGAQRLLQIAQQNNQAVTDYRDAVLHRIKMQEENKAMADSAAAMQKLCDIDPHADDFEGQLVAVVRDNPRSLQDPAFKEMFNFYNGIHNRDVKGKQAEAASDYHNGEGVPKDEAEAAKWYRKAAEKGLASAQHNLGLCYDNGEGVPKDEAEAAKWYRKAAEQGYAEAQCDLGLCYHKGEGVPKDKRESVIWYWKAAEQGLAEAQYNLGYAYANGAGVTKDYLEAYAWYNLAAANGSEGGKLSRDELERKLLPQQVAEGQKRTKELAAEIAAKKL